MSDSNRGLIIAGVIGGIFSIVAALINIFPEVREKPTVSRNIDEPTNNSETVKLKDFIDDCYSGDDRACNKAGLMIGDGEGAAIDLEESANYYKKACGLGSGVGCRNYARRLVQGKGVSKDISDATYYYREACDLGYEKACRELDDLD